MSRGQKDIFLPEPATVLDVQAVTKLEKFFRFKLDGLGLDSMPGQFMEISVPGIGECPISISSSPTRTEDGVFEMVVRNTGNVTGALHRLSPGDRIGARGPYGKPFPVDDAMKGKDVFFICGGIGLVPVRSAIHYVLDHREDYGEVIILLGSRTPEDRMFIDELYEWKVRKDVRFRETVDVADPTWGGDVGVITTLMPHVDIDPGNLVTVVCGPPLMYKFVLLELENLEMPDDNIFLSLERHMKCGVGKCGRCQIGGLYACQDGPVFRYSDIVNVPEAI